MAAERKGGISKHHQHGIKRRGEENQHQMAWHQNGMKIESIAYHGAKSAAAAKSSIGMAAAAGQHQQQHGNIMAGESMAKIKRLYQSRAYETW